MFRVLFLIMILMVPLAFAQTDEKPKAYKVGEFGNLAEKDWKPRLDRFSENLTGIPESDLFIIVYAEKGKSFLSIEDLVEKYRRYLWKDKNINLEKFTILRGGFRHSQITELWIVPKLADFPEPMPDEMFKAEKISELGVAGKEEVKKELEKLCILLRKDNRSGYLLNYGSNKDIAQRALDIRNSIRWSCGYHHRLTIVNAEGTNLKTEFWIVPAYAQPPIPQDLTVNSENSKPEAFVFDDFDKVSKAYYMHSFYDFFNKLIEDKTSMGVVIHYPEKDENETGYLDLMKEDVANHPLFIKNNLKVRIVFFEGEAKKNQETFLWIVPKGARMPKP